MRSPEAPPLDRQAPGDGRKDSANGNSSNQLPPKLSRTTLRTSRLLDFCSRKELIAQTGHEPETWPLVVVKELVDNSLDACEDAGVAPEIAVTVDATGITVQDNGPGIPADTVDGVLDFAIRVSNREMYAAPDRGAQGNALKTIVAMPHVLGGSRGVVDIAARGVRHYIAMEVDQIRQEPVIDHAVEDAPDVKNGTQVTVRWPVSACSILEGAKGRFLQIVDDYTWLNPHLTLSVDWYGDVNRVASTDAKWPKWLPSNPTCPHWYGDEHFERLIAGYISHDADRREDRTVRELVTEFRGLTGSAKQKRVLEQTGLTRTHLSSLANCQGIRTDLARGLLSAMKEHTKPVKPVALGIIGRDHFRQRFEAVGCHMDSFQYAKFTGFTDDDLPWVIETVFGWVPEQGATRRLVTGVNWSPGILNPFRQLGSLGKSCDTVLANQRIDDDDPVILVMHVVCPRVEYTDRGKSAIVMGD